jgi:hypothetical protein
MDGVNGNPALVDSWKVLDDLGDKVPAGFRKDADVVKNFKKVVDDPDLNKHIFDGNPVFNAEGRLKSVTGVHSTNNLKPSSQVNGVRGDSKIQPGTKGDVNDQGFYEAKAQTWGDKSFDGGATWVGGWTKGKTSTFFPDNWTPAKIQAEIANGIKNKTPSDFPVSAGKTSFEATMSDGTKLQLVYDGDVLDSAFPNIR